MKIHLPRSTPSLVLSITALFIALGGTGYAAVVVSTANNAKHLGGQPPSAYLQSRHFAYSHGERFFSTGQTVTLGRNGHFTFTASCVADPNGTTGAQKVTFDVTANTTADLDGNGPMPADTKINIHTDSDAANSSTANPLKAGDFTQVGSASSSTEIAADGQEADIFYNDGVNWPSGNGSAAHDCFAGYTGFIGGFTGSSQG
jgi:hypothetical protein